MEDLQSGLLEWGQEARRDLPWRRTRDPWAVLVSELMLQQTQVTRVVPRFASFLAKFPDAAACAAAPVADVVREWAGLGYNRRAVNLHRAAVEIVSRHGGAVPADLGALRSLPGIGAYTARAVMVFAFEGDVGVVEVNTARVIARAAAGRSLSAAQAQTAADALVPRGRAWAWNQAVLDLGATVCTRRAPACVRCPVAHHCTWHLAGGPDPAAPATRQSTFSGSDRQGRGRLVDALRRGPVTAAGVAEAAGWPDDPDRARRVVEALVTDGLARLDGDVLSLP